MNESTYHSTMKRQDNRATSQDVCVCVCVCTHVYERGLREKGRQRVQYEDNVHYKIKQISFLS